MCLLKVQPEIITAHPPMYFNCRRTCSCTGVNYRADELVTFRHAVGKHTTSMMRLFVLARESNGGRSG